ncbi:patatin-like phospholipase family protein [Vandammella animalimorsus]|uniref:Patatin-like phospholipase family protein n=1 Tax=Vandammella animalimorsus TaxID=2029117 RepID=A0A3M6RLH0_9BURK|nr:patatin-like phospholipase family protein [Vandammella animalimorsus]RMX15442.1 patatin-like phospholipase family protein [Vandammella animalimorsus]
MPHASAPLAPHQSRPPPSVARHAQQQRAAQTALVCCGGGARAAYQVGVLKALARLHAAQPQRLRQSPFGILVGTSAGAINVAALASGADHFEHAVAQLEHTWAGLHTEQVYRSDSWSVLRTGTRWLRLLSLGWAVARWRRGQPQALLDNQPLAELLQARIAMARIPALIERGHLRAVAVTASSYSSGRHMSFYQSATPIQPWQRSLHLACATALHHGHLLASAAIPFVFAAQRLALPHGAEFFGDGSMRQQAPMAPAIHLGAQRILVIGVGRGVTTASSPAGASAPSLAQIAGHALSSIFLDTLATDIERLQRINQTLRLLTPEQQARSQLRPIELLAITPSQDIDALAARHLQQLPASIRALLGALGTGSDARELGHSALVSYLLFEAAFTQELIALGEQDTLRRSQQVLDFMGWQTPPGML